jgi:menaquinone-dependent protoporphyrinogen oxidase
MTTNNPLSVLVAIASSHNTTLEIGNRIAARLRSQTSATVDVLPANEVPAGGVAKYSAVLVGSAIHAGRWLSPARHLLSRERAALAERPVWAFSVGAPPTREALEAEEASVGKAIRREVQALKGHRLFMGKIEKEDLPWVIKLIFTWFPKNAKFGDFRQWDEVESWADQVGTELKSAVAVQP